MNKIELHMNSEKMRQHSQALHRSALDGVLELKGKVDTCPILTQKYSPIDNHLQMKL